MAAKKKPEHKDRRYKVFSYRLDEKTADEFRALRQKSGYSWNRFIKMLLDAYAKSN
jgi:arsenate reductase-like glutaredoxin family protein